MAQEQQKLKTFFGKIPRRAHEALRTMAFERRRSMASIVREAVDEYLKAHPQGEKTEGLPE